MNGSTSKSMPVPVEIKTFAFFDLETTGLIVEGQPMPRITEFAVVAVGREEFLRFISQVEKEENSEHGSSSSAAISLPRKRRLYLPTPRLMSKLTQVINPETEIPQNATEHSGGLTNELVASMPTFAEFAPTIRAFLENLPRPVCLIAHTSGNRFDFRVLESELQRVGSTIFEDVDWLFCVSSIPVFRDIDRKWLREKDSSEAAELSATASRKSEATISTGTEGQTNGNATGNLSQENGDIKVVGQGGSVDVQVLLKNGNLPLHKKPSVDGTPRLDRVTTAARSIPKPVSAASAIPLAENIGGDRPSTRTKRRLHPDVQELKAQRTPLARAKILAYRRPQGIKKNKSSYTLYSKDCFNHYDLPRVQYRAFGVYPTEEEQHLAENDCLRMFHIATRYGNEFINHVDSMAEKYNGTPPKNKKGKKRKM